MAAIRARVCPEDNSGTLTPQAWYEIERDDQKGRMFHLLHVKGGWSYERFDKIESTIKGVMDNPYYRPAFQGSLQKNAPQKAALRKLPELPPECRRDEFGMTRSGVDFMAAIRATALATKTENPK